MTKVEERDQLLAQLEQLSDFAAEVERDTAVRFEQAESLVKHVDELARRGQAELEGQLKQPTGTMEVQLHEYLAEFKDTSFVVDELGVMLERRGRDIGELTKFVLENFKIADRLHNELKNTVLDVKGRVDNLEQWGEELAASL